MQRVRTLSNWVVIRNLVHLIGKNEVFNLNLIRIILVLLVSVGVPCTFSKTRKLQRFALGLITLALLIQTVQSALQRNLEETALTGILAILYYFVYIRASKWVFHAFRATQSINQSRLYTFSCCICRILSSIDLANWKCFFARFKTNSWTDVWEFLFFIILINEILM